MKKLLMVLMAASAAGVVSANSTVDLMFVYDQSAQSWLVDNSLKTAYANRQLEKLNRVLSNSGLSECRFRLAGTYDFAEDFGGRVINEVIGLDPDRFATDSKWAPVRAKREELKADVVVIFIDKDPSSKQVGEGVLLRPSADGVNRLPDCDSGECLSAFLDYHKAHAYAICDVSTCAADDCYTVAHEVGHVMGAGHPYAVDNVDASGFWAKSQGVAYVDPVDGQRYTTLMGYATDKDGNHYKVLPILAAPNNVNEITGTTVGDATHDNASTLRHTFPLVAGFYKAAEDPVNPAPVDPDPVVNDYFSFPGAVVKCGGVWNGSRLVGVVQLKIGKTKLKTHESKFSGNLILLDGKKRSFKAINKKTVLVGDYVEESFSVKNSDAILKLKIDSETFGGTWDGLDIRESTDEALSGTGVFSFVDGAPEKFSTGDEVIAVAGGKIILPEAQELGLGGSWSLPKGGKVKLDRETGELLLSGENVSGLKLKFNPKTNTFKGSFKFYVLVNSKLKSFPATVTGVSSDGIIAGVYLVKKTKDTGVIAIYRTCSDCFGR